MIKLIRKFWKPVYEGEDEAAAAAAAATKAAEEAAATKAAEEAAAAAAAAAGGSDKKFSQDEVNKFLAEAKRKDQEKTGTLTNEIEALKAKNDLTVTEQKRLETANTELRKLNVTADQIKKEDEKKIRTDYEGKLTDVTKERDTWKDLFTTAEIDRSIIDASVSHDAFAPAQVVAILKPQTSLKEAVDSEGKPTGSLTPKVSFKDIKEGEPITLELTPAEAVKRMTEMDEYLNLFKGKGAGGIGGSNRSGGGKGGKMTAAEAAKAYKDDPAKFKEWRKTNGLD